MKWKNTVWQLVEYCLATLAPAVYAYNPPHTLSLFHLLFACGWIFPCSFHVQCLCSVIWVSKQRDRAFMEHTYSSARHGLLCLYTENSEFEQMITGWVFNLWMLEWLSEFKIKYDSPRSWKQPVILQEVLPQQMPSSCLWARKLLSYSYLTIELGNDQ